jgi:hypothetical protein
MICNMGEKQDAQRLARMFSSCSSSSPSSSWSLAVVMSYAGTKKKVQRWFNHYWTFCIIFSHLSHFFPNVLMAGVRKKPYFLRFPHSPCCSSPFALPTTARTAWVCFVARVFLYGVMRPCLMAMVCAAILHWHVSNPNIAED